MQTVPLHQVKAGSTLASNLYAHGRLHMRKGYRLTARDIKNLRSQGWRSIPIDTNIEFHTPKGEIINPETREKSVKNVYEVFNDFENLNEKTFEKVRLSAERIVDEIMVNEKIKLQTHDLRSWDDYTYYHCVNVAAISVAIGKCMFYDDSDLKELATGAMVHDLGKMRIPKSILYKEGPLTEEEREIVEEHPLWGFHLLARHTNTSPIVWAMARQHHEYMDGSGYPDGRRGKDIHPFARIMRVADMWDAMRSDRPFQGAQAADKILQKLNSKEMKDKLDPEVMEILNSMTVRYPMGTKVELNNGMVGVVIRENEDVPHKPDIHIILDEKGNKVAVDDRMVVSLLEESGMSIINSQV